MSAQICNFRCPAGAEDGEGNYVPCKGEGYSSRTRLRDHMTRVHCTGGDQYKTSVKQLKKSKVAEWFVRWKANNYNSAQGWAMIHMEIYPNVTVTPEPFYASKDNFLARAEGLTEDDKQNMKRIAYEDLNLDLPDQVIQYFPFMLQVFHKHLCQTGGEPILGITPEQVSPSSDTAQAVEAQGGCFNPAVELTDENQFYPPRGEDEYYPQHGENGYYLPQDEDAHYAPYDEDDCPQLDFMA